MRIKQLLTSRPAKWTGAIVLCLVLLGELAMWIAPRPIGNAIYEAFHGYSSTDLVRFEQLPAAQNLVQNGFEVGLNQDNGSASTIVEFVRCPTGCGWHEPADDEQHITLTADKNPDGSFTTAEPDMFYMIDVDRPDGRVNCTVDLNASGLVDLRALPEQVATIHQLTFNSNTATTFGHIVCTLHKGD
ncbi:MAG TPA: hypothetical protein VLG40_04910 [Candidatus Saccharimonas sp.]|nr:hypothetical protein [Candidatus Saccharimonas sp.]